MSRRIRSVCAIGLAVCIGGAIWLIAESKNGVAGGEAEVPQRFGKEGQDLGAPRGQATRSATSRHLHWLEIRDGVRRLNKALESGDPKQWGPALGDLMDARYRRGEAIEALLTVLDYPAPEVRVAAARQLLELGSSKGVSALQSILLAGARREDVSEELVVRAAASLHDFRQAVDGSLVYAAFERFRTPDLLLIAAAQKAPEVAAMVRRQEGPWVYLGALAEVEDPVLVEGATRFLETPGTALLGHWALYRALDDESHVAPIIDAVKEIVGLLPRSAETPTGSGAQGRALHLLQMSVTPTTRNALREIADYAARESTTYNGAFSRAFAALFYVYEDYDFVDRRVNSFLKGEYSGPAVDSTQMWLIAAARGTAEMRALAQEADPNSYEHYFLLRGDRPVETWISGFFPYMPIDIIPPVAVGEE